MPTLLLLLLLLGSHNEKKERENYLTTGPINVRREMREWRERERGERREEREAEIKVYCFTIPFYLVVGSGK